MEWANESEQVANTIRATMDLILNIYCTQHDECAHSGSLAVLFFSSYALGSPFGFMCFEFQLVRVYTIPRTPRTQNYSTIRLRLFAEVSGKTSATPTAVGIQYGIV